ncbi:MAG: hypothetical protein AMJ43_00710 [Coxiella sp. DG_40]|nr:MAG: hypothetical protein AMJ43_00710 [Coxiella sp. DG_40]
MLKSGFFNFPEKEKKEKNKWEKGEGFKESKEIKKLREKALKLSDPKSRDAQFKMGRCSESLNDNKKAYHWYKMAADRGHLKALLYLGQLHLNEIEGIEKNTELGLQYIATPADKGLLEAKYTLTDIYLNGLYGIGCDLGKARQVIGKTAEEGDNTAQLKMGMICEKAELIEEAKAWYIRAARSKRKEIQTKAKESINRLPTASIVAEDGSGTVSKVNELVSSIVEQSEEGNILINELEFLRDRNNKISLGKGASAEVFLAKYNGIIVAVKALNLAGCQPKDLEDFQREISLMMRLHHKNIIKFYGVYPGKNQNTPSIVMERMEGGSLDGVLYDTDKQLLWKNRFEIAEGISFGLAYLHGQKPTAILHRDLKSQNVLLDKTGKPKITDFGISRFKAPEMTQQAIGTPAWLAPEVLKPPAKYSEKSDIFALGMLFWEIAARKVPFDDCKNNWDVPNAILTGNRPPMPDDCDCPQAFKKLIEWCWQQNQEDRPTAEEVVKYLDAHRNEIIEHDVISPYHNNLDLGL